MVPPLRKVGPRLTSKNEGPNREDPVPLSGTDFNALNWALGYRWRQIQGAPLQAASIHRGYDSLAFAPSTAKFSMM